MRNFIIAVALMVAPLATWMAGCRDSGAEARFPGGPEMKRLAQTEPAIDRGAPEIPDRIDPDVVLAPDPPTFARIRMVMDREAQIAGRQAAAPGLFVLPRQDYYELAETRPASGGEREFASRSPSSAASLFHRGNGMDGRQDISAMAPPGVPNDFGMPERSAAHQPLPPEPPPLAPEYIPGVFMGTDAEAKTATPPFDEPLSLAPPDRQPPPAERFEPPPRLSSASFDTVALDDLIRVLRETTPSRRETPSQTDPAPRTPDAPGRGLAELLEKTDVALALAPLPDLSNTTTKPAPGEMGARPNRPENRNSEEKIPASPDAMRMMAELNRPRVRDDGGIASLRDNGDGAFNHRFMLDFPASASPDRRGLVTPISAGSRAPDKSVRPSGGVVGNDSGFLDGLLPLEFADSGLAANDAWNSAPLALSALSDPPATAEKPNRVALTPIRKIAGRGLANSGFERIDSSVEAPPLVF